MVFPYVPQDRLELELDVEPEGLGLSDSEWQTLLSETLKTESERVEGEGYTGETWRPDYYSQSDVPRVVQAAVITLSQSAIRQRESAGLESESTGDGASYNYRPSAQIREEVRAELAQHDFPPDEDGGEPDDPTVRSSLI